MPPPLPPSVDALGFETFVPTQTVDGFGFETFRAGQTVDGFGFEAENDPNFVPILPFQPGPREDLNFDLDSFDLDIDPSQFQIRLFFELEGQGIIHVGPHLVQARVPRVLSMKSADTFFTVNLGQTGFSTVHFASFVTTFSQQYPLDLEVDLTDFGRIRVLLLGDA